MSDSVFGGSEHNQVYVALNLVFSFIASLASVLTLMLIRKMQVRTGHVTLIYYMTWFQLMYDCTLFFSNVDCGYYVTAVANFFQLFGGVSSSLISNWIAFIAYFIIIYRQRFDIFGNFYSIMLIACLPGFANGVFYLYTMIPESDYQRDLERVAILFIYYYIRLGSIFLNFLFCGVAFYKVQLISSSKLANHKSVQETAIRTLALRMVYYPIVQAISRSGYAWYEQQYGMNIDQDDVNTTQYACLIFLTIITPSVSIGYLIIFLVMQPDAYRTFEAMMLCRERRDSFDGDEPDNYRSKDFPVNSDNNSSDPVPPMIDAPPIIQAPPSQFHRDRPLSASLMDTPPSEALSTPASHVQVTITGDPEQGGPSTVINPLRISAVTLNGGGRGALGMSFMGASSMGVHSEASDTTTARVRRTRRKSSKRDMRDDEELIRIIADHEHLNRGTGMLERMKSIVPFSNKRDSMQRSEIGRSTADGEDHEYFRTHLKGDSLVLPNGQRVSFFSRASTSSVYSDAENVRNSARYDRASHSSVVGEGRPSTSLPVTVRASDLLSELHQNQTL
jgi:hypothetical protein